MGSEMFAVVRHVFSTKKTQTENTNKLVTVVNTIRHTPTNMHLQILSKQY